MCELSSALLDDAFCPPLSSAAGVLAAGTAVAVLEDGAAAPSSAPWPAEPWSSTMVAPVGVGVLAPAAVAGSSAPWPPEP
jgi:hypothetical protein